MVPRIIAHRGASGLRPEHTLAAYELAIEAGVDAIELDLVPTRDGSLIARHDNELSITTDVADRAEFATRRRSKIVDGAALTGWFSEDFTIDEIRVLRARQRFDFRSRAFDGSFPIPSLDDVLNLARDCIATDRSFRIYLELKHAAYFASIGLPFDQTLPPILGGTGFQPVFSPHGLETRATQRSPIEICIESFEPEVLRVLRDRIPALICQLIDDPRCNSASAELIDMNGLRNIKEYADGVGVWKRLIVPTLQTDDDSSSITRLASPTSLIDTAHRAGLFVDAWTFRDEPQFLAADYNGDPIAEYRQFAALGVDGVITDFPHTALRIRSEIIREGKVTQSRES